MKPITRDILVGVVAGLAAVAVLSARRERVQIPHGLYQASLDLPKHREMAQMLRPRAGSAATIQRLQTKLDAPDVQGAAFDQVLAYLADASGIDIHVDWAVLADAKIPRNAKVAVRFQGVTVADALRQALAAIEASTSTRLAYQIEGDRLRVSTNEVLSREKVTRVYDVREIIRSMVHVDRSLLPPTRPPRVDPPEPKPPVPAAHLPWPPNDFVTSPRQAIETLRETVVYKFDPPGWRDNGGTDGSVHYIAGRLVVTQTRPTQDEIALWLQWLNEELANPSPKD